MISSKADYERYLEADRLALRIKRKKPKLYGDEIWKFERLLRKCEYLYNCPGAAPRIFYLVTKFRFNELSKQLGFSIYFNTIGPGLSIAHRGTISINSNARIGANCRIHVCVSIGASGGSSEAPVIGNNVYIAPGAKIYGAIEIADNIAIGANAVVNKSFLEPNITIAGVPARKISDKGSAEAGWGVAYWPGDKDV